MALLKSCNLSRGKGCLFDLHGSAARAGSEIGLPWLKSLGFGRAGRVVSYRESWFQKHEIHHFQPLLAMDSHDFQHEQPMVSAGLATRPRPSIIPGRQVMLAADKLLLTSTIRKNATELKGKELALHKAGFFACSQPSV